MSKEIKYEAALEQLQNIVYSMENDRLGLDELTDKLKEAQRLIKLCKQKLAKTDEEIQEILENN